MSGARGVRILKETDFVRLGETGSDRGAEYTRCESMDIFARDGELTFCVDHGTDLYQLGSILEFGCC